jgi:hypothetical protein
MFINAIAQRLNRKVVRFPILAGVLVLLFGAGIAAVRLAPSAAAYSYQSRIYNLWNISYSDKTQEAMYVSYGSWSCGGGICSIPIWTIQQYVNINTLGYEFTCWTQEVYTAYFYNIRFGSRTTNYSTTPWYNTQSTWGYADSAYGDQTQYVSLGTNGSECGLYGSGGGAHIETAIIRNSSSAYTSVVLW